MENERYENEPLAENETKSVKREQAGSNVRISRRAMLASLGVTGAAGVSGGLMQTIRAEAAEGDPCACVGDLSDLETTEKSTIVGAINENHDRLDAADPLIETIRKKTMRMVSLDDFNALGDGSDDTAAIQAAINYLASLGSNVKKALKIPRAFYRFTSLFIPKSANGLLIFADGLKGARLICTDETAAPAIRTEAPNVQFKSIDLEGSQNYDFRVVQKTGILAKRAPGEQADIDIEFNDCRISRFYYGIEIWGRGFVSTDRWRHGCRSLCEGIGKQHPYGMGGQVKTVRMKTIVAGRIRCMTIS